MVTNVLVADPNQPTRPPSRASWRWVGPLASVVVAAVTVALTACSSSGRPAAQPPSSEGGSAEPVDPAWEIFKAGGWTLAELRQDGGPVALQTDLRPVTITFDKERVSGSDGCNTFTGEATVSATEVRFGPLATTLMACPEGTTTTLVGKLLTQPVVAWTVTAGQLHLSAAGIELICA